MLFCLALPASSLAAQDIPHYDIEAICKIEAPEIAVRFAKGRVPTGEQIASALKDCVQVEEEELAELKTMWPKVSARVKSDCVKAMGGAIWEDKDYASLLLCIKYDKRTLDAKKKSR